MRILLATPIGSPGGIARWAEHIFNYYKNYSKESDLCEIDILPMTLSNGKRVVYNGLWYRIKKGILGYSKIIQQEKALLRDGKYDIIHIHY